MTWLLTQLECLRAVINARLRGDVDDAEHLARRQAIYAKLRGVSRLPPVLASPVVGV